MTSAIGNTPLLHLHSLYKETGCHIYGKAEFMNPGGSVKDRAALYLVKDAIKSGLKPGGTVVEGTAGNTGIGLAHVCNSLGFKCTIFMPNTQSAEKINLLGILGATVKPVPAVPITDPQNYNNLARDHAKSIPNAVWTNQFDNTANRLAHIETTGPEILQQTNGTIDAFTCSTGTGGTLAGISRYLKQNSKAQVFLADPPGSVLYSLKQVGKLERTGDGSITEGIGQGRLTSNLAEDFNQLDGAVHIPDSESIAMVYKLLDTEGLFLGASSALNVAAAVKVAKILGPGHTVVTILCDAAYRYQSRLFSKSWLESKSLLEHIPNHLRRYITLE